jgi:hypothetical protein
MVHTEPKLLQLAAQAKSQPRAPDALQWHSTTITMQVQRYTMQQTSQVLLAIRGKRPRYVAARLTSSWSSSSVPQVMSNASKLRNHNTSCNTQQRWKSNLSSNNNDVSTAVKGTNNTKRRRKNSRKKQSFSPLMHISSSHPKNTNPPNSNNSTTTTNTKLLTRKQLLRLTPKQRANLQRYRIQQHKDSMSYLQKARVNIRSNLNYLGDTAGSNFKKNMVTIQRLFKGEEVWKDEDVALTSKHHNQQQHLKNNRQHQEEEGLDWERLPSEIKQNVQSNLVSVQNWLHKATDGMIPSPSPVNSDGKVSGSDALGSSVATRVQQFHQAKQSSSLVIDRKWIAWNVALAMLPGALIGLYLHSMQDEMKEYYIKLEEQERARILGPSANIERKDASQQEQLQQQNDSNEEKNGMGISSALISESGSMIDKVKMAVNDLFLGGVEERVGKDREKEIEDEAAEDCSTEQLQSSNSVSTKTQNTSAPTPLTPQSESEATLDPAMEILLHRIESLEKQLGIEKGSNLTGQQQQQQQQQQHEHLVNTKERTQQSPMQMRRDSSLAAAWRKQEEKMAEEGSKPSDESSDSFWNFIIGVKSLLDKDISSVRDRIRQQVGTLEDLITNKTELSGEEDTAEEIVDEVTGDASIIADLSIEAVNSSSNTAEEEDKEINADQVIDMQEKGFRAWLSRTFRRQQNNRNHHPATKVEKDDQD